MSDSYYLCAQLYLIPRLVYPLISDPYNHLPSYIQVLTIHTPAVGCYVQSSHPCILYSPKYPCISNHAPVSLFHDPNHPRVSSFIPQFLTPAHFFLNIVTIAGDEPAYQSVLFFRQLNFQSMITSNLNVLVLIYFGLNTFQCRAQAH